MHYVPPYVVDVILFTCMVVKNEFIERVMVATSVLLKAGQHMKNFKKYFKNFN